MYEPVLSTKSIKLSDKDTIETVGIEEIVLMENAGASICEYIKDKFVDSKKFLIFCGKGNNGGDGLVVARRLYEDLFQQGAFVTIVLLSAEKEFSGSAYENLKLLKEIIRKKQNTNQEESRLELIELRNVEQLNQLPMAEIIVDAIFGTGLSKEIVEPQKSVIEWINEQKKTTISIDIPSGINGDTGQINGVAVKADITITMAAKKLGLLIEDGQDYSGKVTVAEIGIPDYVLNKYAALNNSAFSVNDSIVSNWLPKRSWKSHKYSNGMSFIIAGSLGLSGAAVMCSQAASSIGAGAVVCACPKNIQPVIASKLTEVMTLPLEDNENGALSKSSLELIQEKSKRASALLIGPGLGRQSETIDLIIELIENSQKPMVIDADGLYALSKSEDITHVLKNKQCILTPHWEEFKKLTGISEDLSYFERINKVRKYSQKWNCTILLKGFPSIIGISDGSCYLNPTGNPAASSAGHGDVLAGFCLGLLSQGLGTYEAALSAIYIAGSVADEYVKDNSEKTFLASKTLELLPCVMKQRFDSKSSS